MPGQNRNNYANIPGSKPSIRVTKRDPPKCSLCNESAEYWLSYNDPLKPGPCVNEHSHSIPYYAPTISLRACRAHLIDVNYLLLQDAGLAPKLPKEDAYVGTTDEPKT